jgi:hypothetical protein
MKSWYLRAGQSPQPIDFHSHNFPKRIFCSSDPHYPCSNLSDAKNYYEL